MKYKSPLLLLLLSLLAYAIYIPWFGFYGDDWSYIWYQHLLGFGGSGDFAAYDRPFSAMYYNVVIFLLGESVWPYQILAITLRWISGVLAWLVLKKVWPRREQQVFGTAVLFVLYPGFGQQPVSVEFILHFAVLDLFLLSLLILLISPGKPAKPYWIWTVISMTASASLFALEYFIGLEILRPIFLWMVLAERYPRAKERIRKTLQYWAPYGLVLFAFLYWRIFIFKFPTYQPGLINDVLSNPASTIPGLIKRVVVDFKEVLLDAWQSLVRYPVTNDLVKLYLAVVGIGLIACLIYFYGLKDKNQTDQDANVFNHWRKNWHLQAGLIAILSMLAAGLPFWVTGIPLEISFPWDRTTLPFMFGACLLLVVVLDLFIRPRFLPLVLSLLISLCLGAHLMNAETYRQEWDHMRSFYWQLSWRAPVLQPGTILTSDQIPLFKVSDSGMTAPLNWTYAPDYHNRNLLYKVFDLDLRLDGDYAGIPQVKSGLPITHDYRSLLFSSNTDSLLVFYDKRDTCLHILSPLDGAISGLPEKINRVLPLSNLSLISESSSPAFPPAQVFGAEPAHDWCYFYQKADLARQQKNWSAVVDFWHQAQSQSLTASDPVELLPFIEGLAFQKDLNTAGQLSEQVFQSAGLRSRLCLSWSMVFNDPAMLQEHDSLISIMNNLHCELK
ncbi:MAG: hypothetical protein LWX83_10335 [Anaerolineae bacterium]|nr:hypothetical protein [Anaerolineae bacterium]